MIDLKAWRVEINSMSCICFAHTQASARMAAVLSYWNAGYGRKGKFPRVKTFRMPNFDSSPLKDKKQKCWTPEYVENYP